MLFRGSGHKGSAATEIVVFVAVIVFVLFPLFSVVLEKYLLVCKGQIIKDAVDLSNISVYHAINTEKLSETAVTFNNTVGNDEVQSIYHRLLAQNLNLKGTLEPNADSIAEAPVRVESLICYISGFPATCPQGTILKRPTIHSVIVIPVKPALYRQLYLNALGKDALELRVHVDTDIPVDD